MSDKPRKIKHSRFEYINPNILIEKPRVLKHLRFEYLIPEFARHDFKIPSEEDPIEKGNEPMGSEHYETLVLDIETYTKHALKLQMAIIEADSKLAKATRKHQKASARVREASKEWDEAEAALDDAMDEFKKHLDIIRNTHVTLRKGSHE